MGVCVNALTLEDCVAPVETLTDQAAFNRVLTLGGLAPWWLAPEVLERAARRNRALRIWLNQPTLPSKPGCCWIVLVAPSPLPQLRGGLVLPLRWRKDFAHSPRLPASLHTLAEQVAEQLEARDWGLDLNDDAGLADVDLSGLGSSDMGVSSGWAALVGGLILARENRSPRVEVLATAAWDADFGIRGVKGIEEKLTAALEWGVKEVFLPAENEIQALEWLRGRTAEVEIEPLLPVASTPRIERLLDRYLARLGAEPPAEAPFEVRRSHYIRIDFKEAQVYYWGSLLDEAVTRCIRSLQESNANWNPTHLVTVVSGTASIVVMGPLASGVKHCLLLYEEDEKGQVPKHIADELQKVKTKLDAHGIYCQEGRIRIGVRDDELGQMEGHLRAFAAGVEAANLVADLTPGFKALTLTLQEVAPPGSWLIYCRHRQVRDSRVDPGTEQYERWKR